MLKIAKCFVSVKGDRPGKELMPFQRKVIRTDNSKVIFHQPREGYGRTLVSPSAILLCLGQLFVPSLLPFVVKDNIYLPSGTTKSKGPAKGLGFRDLKRPGHLSLSGLASQILGSPTCSVFSPLQAFQPTVLTFDFQPPLVSLCLPG